MEPVCPDSPFLLKHPHERPIPGDPGKMPENQPDPEEKEDDELIVCRQCLQIVTRPEERMEVDGSHVHTFANPQGIVFEIGCFRSVTGCGFSGSPSSEFTWFSGYQWRVAVCGGCLSHLGWLFQGGSGDSFCGLILNRLAGAL